MAKFLDTIGLTHLIGELDARYAAQFAAIGHTHSQYLTSVPNLASSKITTLGGYTEGSSTSTLTSSMTLNQALASLQNQIQAKTSNTGTVTSVTITAGEGISVNSSAAITTTGSRTITLKEATNSSLGGIQLKAAKRTSNLSSSITTGRTTSSRYYGVELDTNGLAFVNVPWTDTNTTYSAGDNISISGSKISSPDVSVSSSGSGYVSNISANGHGISVTKTALPTISVSDSGSGTFVTDVTASGHTITLIRGNAPSTPSITVKDSGTGTFVTDVTASGHTITLTRGNGSTYTLPVATSSALGGIKIGYSGSTAKTYPVLLNSSNQAYVNVPWTDTNTTYSAMTGATSSAAGKTGLVPAPAAGSTRYLSSAGTWTVPTDTKNTTGSSNSSSKLFLVGATSQATSATTYSHDTVYVDANGRLNSRQSESGTTVSAVVTAADAMSTADIDAIFESLL